MANKMFITRLDSRRQHIQKLLEPDEDLLDLLGCSELRHGIGEGIVILQLEQWREFFRIQFFHSHIDIVG
jgi:hypothetical protein